MSGDVVETQANTYFSWQGYVIFKDLCECIVISFTKVYLKGLYHTNAAVPVSSYCLPNDLVLESFLNRLE